MPRSNAILQAAPTSFIWSQNANAEMSKMSRSKGEVRNNAQRCQSITASPTSFIWSRHDHAAMPRGERSKGRVTISLQKCHAEDTLPNQLQGVI